MALKFPLLFVMVSLAVSVVYAQTPAPTPVPEAPKKESQLKIPEGIIKTEGEYFFNINAEIGTESPGRSYQAIKREAKKLATEKCQSWGYKTSSAFYYHKKKDKVFLTDTFCSNIPDHRVHRAVMMKERIKRQAHVTTDGRWLAGHYGKTTIKGYKTTDLAGEHGGTVGVGHEEAGTDGNK